MLAVLVRWRRFLAACPGCGAPIPAGQVMCSVCAVK